MTTVDGGEERRWLRNQVKKERAGETVQPEAESVEESEVADGVGRKSSGEGGGREPESHNSVVQTLDTTPAAWAGIGGVSLESLAADNQPEGQKSSAIGGQVGTSGEDEAAVEEEEQ